MAIVVPVSSTATAEAVKLTENEGGTVSPFVAYLSQRQQVSDNELAELEALVAQLQSRRHEG